MTVRTPWEKLLSATFLIAALVGTSPAFADKETQVRQLLDFFKGSCPSTGAFTQEAANMAGDLITVIRGIKDDPNCATISEAMASLHTLNRRISELQSKTYIVDEWRIRHERGIHSRHLRRSIKREKALAALDPNDPLIESEQSTQVTIKKSLYDLQIELAGILATVEADQRQRDKEARIISEVVRSTDVLLQTALANQKCLLDAGHTNVLLEIGALASNVASATGYDQSSLIMGGITELIGSVVGYFRKKNLVDEINHVVETSLEGAAYSCVLKALSNKWCENEENLEILKINTSRGAENPLYAGTKIADYAVPVFFEWLEVVRDGTASNKPSQVEEQVEVDKKEQVIKSSARRIDAVIDEKLPLFEAASSAQERWSRMKEAINELARHFLHTGDYDSNPLRAALNRNDAWPRYFLFGFEENEIPVDRNGNSLDFQSEFNPFDPNRGGSNTFIPNLEVVRKRGREWVELAKARFEREREAIIQPDPEQVISSFFDLQRSGTRRGISPHSALLEIRDFLTTRKPTKFDNIIQKRIYETTAQRLVKILAELEGYIDPSNLKPLSLSSETISRVREIAEIDDGVGFFRKRVTNAVSRTLQALIEDTASDGEGNGILSTEMAIQLLAAEDTIEELRTFSNQESTTAVSLDIKQAQTILDGTLQAFVNVFGKNINRVLDHYSEQADSESSYLGNYSSTRTAICLTLLSVPEWPDSIDPAYCQGSFLPSHHSPQGIASVRFDKAMIRGQSREERACYFHDYMRSERIQQIHIERVSTYRR